MTVEIGSLVVRGTFGNGSSDAEDTKAEIQDELQRLRRELLSEMRDMIGEFEHRRADR